jgi:hypothetical protein
LTGPTSSGSLPGTLILRCSTQQPNLPRTLVLTGSTQQQPTRNLCTERFSNQLSVNLSYFTSSSLFYLCGGWFIF